MELEWRRLQLLAEYSTSDPQRCWSHDMPWGNQVSSFMYVCITECLDVFVCVCKCTTLKQAKPIPYK